MGAQDGSIVSCKLDTETRGFKTSKGHGSVVTSIASSNPTRLVTCGLDGRIFFWASNRLDAPLLALQPAMGSPFAAVDATATDIVCAITQDGHFAVYDMTQKVLIPTNTISAMPGVTSMRIWNDKVSQLSFVAIGALDGNVQIWLLKSQ